MEDIQQDPPNDDAEPQLSSLLTSKRLPFALETLLLIVLAAADVILTNSLINGGRHVEANPIAAWILVTAGARGMAIYKFVLIAIICTLAQIIAIYRARAGLFVMWFGVIAHALVVMYSVFQVIGN
ncbi:MAG: DUF5658 family protein [Pirellulales bacterium]|nr:DUF5658 family protein [Pirellulales bacterium]